jgi:maltooligosyltrehalose trehalohydrolase
VTRFPPSAFVHCIQNHDQVGNRAMGERLDQDIPLPVYRALSALLLLSPYTPLLWMGQEWAASTPFQFFTDFPKELGQLVTEGRRNEFKAFAAFADPAVRDHIPDPQAEETFVHSRLRWEERSEAPHKGMLALYSELLAMRRTNQALRLHDRGHFSVTALGDRALALRRDSSDGDAILVVINLADELRVALEDRPTTIPPNGRRWTRSLWTEDERFGGPGSVVRFEPAELLVVPSPGAVVLCSGNSEGNAR